MIWTSIRRFVFAAFMVAFSFGTSLASAQTGTASLRGVVTDASGGAIVGAAITLTNAQEGLVRSSVSNSSGEYEFLALPPGVYALTAQKDGFQKYEQAHLQLQVNLRLPRRLPCRWGLPRRQWKFLHSWKH